MELEKWYDAIYYNNINIAKEMIKNGFNVSTDNDYAFRRAAFDGNLKLMQLLLNNGANINVNRSYALRTCVYHRNLNCIKFLIKSGAEIHKKCLYIAVNGQLFDDSDSDLDHREAAENGTDLKIVKILIKNGVELDTGDNELIDMLLNENETDYEYIKYLIDKGLVIYSHDNILHLYSLIDDDRLDILELLLKNGLDASNLIPAMIEIGNKDAIDLLFEYGADMKKITEKDFLDACDNHYIHANSGLKFPKLLVNLLIKQGLPKKFLDEMYDIACEYEDNEMIEYLEKIRQQRT